MAATAIAGNDAPDFVLETLIATPRERVWAALTEGRHVRVYHFAASSLKATMKPGGRFDHYLPDGNLMLGGEIVSLDPPHRLEMTFEPGWMGPNAQASRCVYELEETEAGCLFTVLHYAIPAGQEGVADGWRRIAARLKSYLETGAVSEMEALGDRA